MKLYYFVDIQNDFMLPTGALYVPQAETLMDGLIDLVSKAQKDRDDNYDSVIIATSKDWHDGTEGEMAVNGGPFPFHCMRNTKGADLVIKVNEDICFLKKCYNVFDPQYGSPVIESFLKAFTPDEVHVAGVATDYCVKAVVLGLLHRGIKVYLYTKLIKGVFEESTQKALEEMKEAGAIFVEYNKKFDISIPEYYI